MTSTVWVRSRVVVNTDPQHRCYDGCHFSERVEWGPWTLVANYATPEDAASAATTFKSINPNREYRVV